MFVLAIADVWIGGILALSGTALGILGTVFVERQRREHERRQYWKRDQLEALRSAERLLRGMSDFEPDPDRFTDATDAINDEIEKLDMVVPGSLVKRFTVAADAWRRSSEDNSEFYERWMEFTVESKRFLGTD